VTDAGSHGVSMHSRRGSCRECGAVVPLVRGKWLQVHGRGSAEQPYPCGSLGLCPGSLLPVTDTVLQDRPVR
jgi:hypothetical protein